MEFLLEPTAWRAGNGYTASCSHDDSLDLEPCPVDATMVTTTCCNDGGGELDSWTRDVETTHVACWNRITVMLQRSTATSCNDGGGETAFHSRLSRRWHGDEAVEGGRGRHRFLAIWAAPGLFWAFSSWRIRHFQANNLQGILALVPPIKALQMTLSLLFWERRTIAGLVCLLYLRLIGYKAAFPYFTGCLLVNYFASFYIIFEQFDFVEEDDMHSLHGTLNTNYTMFKRFHGTMQVAIIMVYTRADE
ncbi:hypothetical protein TRIUR3_12571 [Triticum urartu]|uniref:Uncharacterized protein n=1 Tax=Triticum urartu TaxID=4572 RepID=M7ZX98_TRIUA|nr:hypothetical protein TRIUR3_12571 [Triticum urartu]